MCYQGDQWILLMKFPYSSLISLAKLTKFPKLKPPFNIKVKVMPMLSTQIAADCVTMRYLLWTLNLRT